MSGDSITVFGEFHLSTSLARRVQRAVSEIVEDPLSDLSHVGENCALCRTRFVVPGPAAGSPAAPPAEVSPVGLPRGLAEALPIEEGRGVPGVASQRPRWESDGVSRDASESDRAGRQWIA